MGGRGVSKSSSYKILFKDQRLYLKINIIEANKWLCYSYRPPRSNIFDNKGVRLVKRELQLSLLYNPTLEQLKEYIKKRQTIDIATATTAQVEEEDIKEDNKEVLAIIKRASNKGGDDNKDKSNNKDISKTIKAFKE